MGDQTVNVGPVHVLSAPGGPCTDHCPHPSHSPEPGLIRSRSSSCPYCDLPQRHMRDWISECDNGHRWDRATVSEAAERAART